MTAVHIRQSPRLNVLEILSNRFESNNLSAHGGKLFRLEADIRANIPNAILRTHRLQQRGGKFIFIRFLVP